MMAAASGLAVALAAVSAVLGVPIAPEKKATSERWYSIHHKGQRVGYVHVVESRTGEKAAPLRFAYDMAIRVDDVKIELTAQFACRDDPLLTPVKILWQVESGNETDRSEATVDWSPPHGGVLRGRAGNTNVERKLAPNTTTEALVLEVVRRLPFRKGLAIDCHVVQFPRFGVERDRKILYVGEQDVAVAGRKQKLHKFEHREGERLELTLWVNARHELVRVEDRHGLVLELTTKDRALRPVEQPQQPQAEGHDR